MKKFFQDFKAFAIQGNVLNLAVGVMIGGAFSKIVSSLVNDLFMPLIGLIIGQVDFTNMFISLKGGSYNTLADAVAAGEPTLNYGLFLTNVIDFILLALCVFLFVRLFTKLMPPKPEPKKEATRVCPYCFTTISAKATRCPDCTSEVTPTEPEKPAAAQ